MAFFDHRRHLHHHRHPRSVEVVYSSYTVASKPELNMNLKVEYCTHHTYVLYSCVRVHVLTTPPIHPPASFHAAVVLILDL